jgi:hypothetical protein
MNYLTRLCRLLQRLDYSDDQPRDENGRWGSGSGDTSHEHFKSAGVKVKDDLAHSKIQKSAQELFGRHIGPTDVSKGAESAATCRNARQGVGF